MVFRGSILGATVLLVLAIAPAAKSQIIGIDAGAQFFKVALVKPGSPFKIVTNVETKRKTATMIGFEDGVRRFGSEAETLSIRKPKQVFAALPKLLGRNSKHPSVAAFEQKYLPFAREDDKERNLVQLSAGTDRSYATEEAYAMLLTHAREMAERFSGVSSGAIKDVVLTVPSFYSAAERQATLDAAEVAGLKVLSLIEENTAAAVQYGIDRFFPNETHTVLVYNHGASAVQVSIVRFSSYDSKKAGKNVSYGQFEVLGKAWDENVGGGDLDLRLVEYMADDYNKQKSRKGMPDVRTSARAMAKLRKSAEKVKKVLSANKQFPITVESLHNDIDYRGHITREKFEELCSDLFERAISPVTKALDVAGLKASDIDQVEIIGGGVRVPKIQADLKQLLGVESLGVHLNGDESPALGAAFRAANISTAFRVGRVKRSAGMVETTPFGIGVELNEHSESEGEGWSKKVNIIKVGSPLGKKKVVKFQRASSFALTLRYENAPDGVHPLIARYNISGFEPFDKEPLSELGTPKVQLSFFLDNNGLITITKAEATVEQELPPLPDPVVEDTNKTDSLKNNSASTNETEASGVNASDSKSSADDAANSTEGTASADEKKKAPKEKKPRKKIHRVKLGWQPLKMDGDLRPQKMTSAEKKASTDLLADLKKEDELRALKSELKNGLESYVFSTRGYIREYEDELSKVSEDEEREKILEDLEALEDWLYEDGEEGGADAEVPTYKKKRKDMDRRVNSIKDRLVELEMRPKALEAARAVVSSISKNVETWPVLRPQIKAEMIDELKNDTDLFSAWIDEKEAEQSKLSDREEPAFTSKEIASKMKKINAVVSRLLKLKREAPPSRTVKGEGAKKNASGTSDGEEEKDENAGSEEGSADESGADEDSSDSTSGDSAGEGSEEL